MCNGCINATQAAYNQGPAGQIRGAVTKSQSVNASDMSNQTNKFTGQNSTYTGNPSNGGNGALQ